MSKSTLLALIPLFTLLSAPGVEVASESMRVTLDGKGTVTRIVTAAGAELGATRAHQPIFWVKATRTDDFTKTASAEPVGKATCTVASEGAGVKLVYGELGEAVEKVVCTVRPDGRKLRWNIRVEPKPGWAIEETAFPRIMTAERIGTAGEDDAMVTGTAKGGLYRNLIGRPNDCNFSASMPGSLACQFACHYDDRALFYYAAEDGRGHAKRLSVEKRSGGMRFAFIHVDFDERPFTCAYDIVTAAIDGTAARPAVWQDAADLYREWARRQSWCGKPLRDRDDLPKWMRDAPAMVRFGRDWLVSPDRIRAWMKDHWQAWFPKAPLVTALWGWERHGYWVTDYFPVFPGDEPFAALVRDLRKIDAHAFPWPSGYYWVLDYDKRKDGSYAFDDHAAYAAAAGDTHACIDRDGKPYRREPRWLNGGHSTCLCGGDPYTVDWWNRGICLPLVKLGCEMIQIDQNVGGAFRPCWSRRHGHTPGEGLWKRDVFYRQLETMRETMRAVEPDSVVCYEEPCELYNDLIGIQDYRTCEACSDEYASVFNYVYHEWLPCFQSNPRRRDRIWQAHAAADGQMPHLTPLFKDMEGDSVALCNGGFDRLRKTKPDDPFESWERLRGYAGAVWNGRAFADGEVRHDGATSLRLECAKGETLVQVSQNVPLEDATFADGDKLRLSAWLKADRNGTRDGVSTCFLAEGGVSCGGGGRLAFPKAGTGWRQVSAEFKMKPGAHCLRIMNEAGEGAKVWVDSMKLEVVRPDGTTRDLIAGGRDAYDRFMRAWVDLYHGRGRDWLAHGRQIRPPAIDCATVPFSMELYGGRKFSGRRPAVFHSAWETLDGRRALVFVNATRQEQTVGYRWQGRTETLCLQPDEIRLFEVR